MPPQSEPTMHVEPIEPRPYFSVQLQLLEACNLRCTHCYNADAPPLAMPPTAEIDRRLDRIYAFGARLGVVPDIHLSGGEPTLRRDLVEIVEHIMGREGGDALLFTNGTRWTPALASSLWNAGLRFVQVSLEGPEPMTDAVRGDGVFRSAMATLEMLRDAGFRLTVSMTVTGANVGALQSFVEEVDPLELHFHLREIFPLGAGARLAGLSRSQRRDLYQWAVGWSGRSTLGLEDPAHCSVSVDYARDRRGCVAGRNHFCVDVSGAVYPCRPLAFPVGHVDDLQAAWDSPTMVRLRRREIEGQCGRCELRNHCGGCRVYALLDGDLFGEDTRCFADEQGLVRSPAEVRVIARAARAGEEMRRVRDLSAALGRRVLAVVRGS